MSTTTSSGPRHRAPVPRGRAARTARAAREAALAIPAVPRPPAPAAAVSLLDRARDGLARARVAPSAGDRYVEAHLAAIKAAAAVVAAHAQPSRRGLPAVWAQLAKVAPELESWSAYFAAGAPRRAAVEAGRPGAVTDRDADELVRAAEVFAGVVADALDVPLQRELPLTAS